MQRDFMGFKTNPKNRIQKYNDTYDNIKSLNTDCDYFHWHYHQPPKSGIGDQWSDNWDSSDIHYQILGHRIIEREDRILKRVAAAATSNYFRELHVSKGVQIRESTSLINLTEKEGRVSGAVLSSGESIGVDFVICGYQRMV